MQRRLDAAFEAVYALAKSGGRSHRMTVPPDPRRDTDLILIAGLQVGESLLAGVMSEQAEFDSLDKVSDEHEHYWVDAYDDETGWHCTICGLTEYPGDPGIGAAPCPGCTCSTFTGPHKLSDRHPRERSCIHEETA